MNDEAQMDALAQLPKRRLAAMVLDLREQLRMPQDQKAVASLGLVVVVFIAGVFLGVVLAAPL